MMNGDQKLFVAGTASLAAVAALTLALGFFMPASAAEEEEQPENQVVEAVPAMFHVRIMEDCKIEKSEESADSDEHAMVTYRIAPLAAAEHVERVYVNITAGQNGTWAFYDDTGFYEANVTGMVASEVCVTRFNGNHSFAGEFEPASFATYRVEVPEGCEMDASEMPNQITLRQEAEGISVEGIEELPEGCTIDLQKANYGVTYHYKLEKPIEEEPQEEEESEEEE